MLLGAVIFVVQMSIVDVTANVINGVPWGYDKDTYSQCFEIEQECELRRIE